ncbi:hypothetical protein FACS1894199_11490 [Bacteroidia bacterium]|nr:hypothetical protein FACS1894199_11490 [Bacteroidia bacterium]
MAKQADKQAIREWEDFYSQFLADVEVDATETAIDKELRMRRLEADHEAWFAYYFPKYCTAEPADFHKRATRRIMRNRRWYEVRAWSRELAKSARSMFEVLKLALTGETTNFLLVSNSWENAARLLTPFRLQLEKNLRIINDYGQQVIEGQWEAGEFTAKCGCAFRALGAGQSPRGTRNEAKRPDFILIDDIDTDEECHNPDRIKKKWDWIEQALIPTVSVSGDIRILFNGNVIAKDCCVTRAGLVANCYDIINIRDKNGKSVWDKNSEDDIDFILSKISTRSAQQEYFNNPLSEGDVFKEITYGKIPPLRKFPFLCAYGDPSPSNNKNKVNSMKAVWLIGVLEGKYYVIDGRLDRATNAEFVDWVYDINSEVPSQVQVYNLIENNTLQNPFYEQVIVPLFEARAKISGVINITPDERKKPDKYSRIEGNLEPLNRLGKLIFNVDKKDDPHFKRLEEQFLLLTPQLKAPADGPDCIEGGVWCLSKKSAVLRDGAIKILPKRHNAHRI